MSVRVNKCLTDNDETVMSSSKLINVVSGTLGVSDFIKNRARRVFLKRSGGECSIKGPCRDPD